MMVRLLLLLSLQLSMVAADMAPDNFHELECQFHAWVYQQACSKVASSPAAIHDGLRLGNCSSVLDLNVLEHQAQANILHQPRAISHNAPMTLEVFVSTTGRDDNTGTIAAPVATIQRALQLVRQQRNQPNQAAVTIREGKYYLNETIFLSELDSHLVIQNYNDEAVILSGAIDASAANWQAYDGNIYMAHINVSSHIPPSPPTPTPEPSCVVENGIDYAGHDLHTATAPSPEACCDVCAAYPGCLYFTWFQATQGPSTCYLKSSSAGRHVEPTRFSGSPGSPPVGPSYGPAPAVVNSVYVNGKTYVRARYPNGNPSDVTGICFATAQFANENCTWLTADAGLSYGFDQGTLLASLSSDIRRGSSPTYGCDQCHDWDTYRLQIYDPPQGHPVYNKPMPHLGWTNNSYATFWATLFDRSAGFVSKVLAERAANWKRFDTAVVHMLHSHLWGGWQYQMKGADLSNATFFLGYGGYQEARGSHIGTNRFYIENVFEELDQAGEWYYDEQEQLLFVYFNESDSPQSSQVSVAVLDSLFHIEGNQSAATNIVLHGLTFTETKSTFMEQYEVPSGGDWSLHRDGAVLFDNVEQVAVSNCTFVNLGGNGAVLSNHVLNSSITDCEMTQLGDSGIIVVGRTLGFNGTAPLFPFQNTIARNHIHDYGLYGKQTSCIFQAVAGNTSIVDNVCYNGPRANININDGFWGGNWIEGNILFNGVRETTDHGQFNSWDRQVWLVDNGVDDGYNTSVHPSGLSVIRKEDQVTRNIIINGYNGIWTLDHDDGSQFYNDTGNVMLWGGCKSYKGHSKSCSGNFILYPGNELRSAPGSTLCMACESGYFANSQFEGNACIVNADVPYTTRFCKQPYNHTFFYTANNRFFTTSGNWSFPGCNQSSLQEWQSFGKDRGSSVTTVPDAQELVSMANDLVGTS